MIEGEAEMEAETKGKIVGEGIELAAGIQSRAQKEKKKRQRKGEDHERSGC